MAAVQPEELLHALQAALHQDLALRRRAESHLHEAFRRPGAQLGLLGIATAAAVDAGAPHTPSCCMRASPASAATPHARPR